MKNRNLNNSDDWETPKELYDKLNKEFTFDYDPCPLNAKFNGLLTEWGKSNFINPPYSRKIKEQFIERAHYLWKTQNKRSVLLLPVSTSTKIFHKYIYNQAEIRFIKGRVSFKGINTKGEYVTTKKPMHDSMIVIFRELK
jgi:site-specific DNA-methyltransferase (adenine-specific)